MLEAQFTTIRKRFDCAIVPGESDSLRQLREELTEYFAGTLRNFKVPLVYPGSPFQRRVWDELLRIRAGEEPPKQAASVNSHRGVLGDVADPPAAETRVDAVNH